MAYHMFIRSFKTNVENLCSCFDSRLTRLLQYTAGEAKDAIRSAAYIGGKKGYEQALASLARL